MQINLTSESLTFGFVKEIAKPVYVPRLSLLGIDVGLRNLVATSEGDLMGRNLIDRLIPLDHAIATLAANRQQQGLRVRCRRYDALTLRLRALLKNEIHRVVNRLIEVHAPKEIAIEHLDFRSPDLSKRMNRIVQRFGRRIFRDALSKKIDELGLIVTEVNAAYTSQTCSTCGYIDKNNRNGERFVCRHCQFHSHADINAARNIRARRSDPRLASRYVPRSNILEEVTSRFLERCNTRPHSRPRQGILSNPYFTGLAGRRTQLQTRQESATS